MVAAGHRMVADGWAMFEEAIEGGRGGRPAIAPASPEGGDNTYTATTATTRICSSN